MKQMNTAMRREIKQRRTRQHTTQRHIQTIKSQKTIIFDMRENHLYRLKEAKQMLGGVILCQKIIQNKPSSVNEE